MGGIVFFLGEIVQKRLDNSNLAAVFPNYNTFKFRGLARESTAKLPAPTIGLPFRIKIPVG